MWANAYVKITLGKDFGFYQYKLRIDFPGIADSCTFDINDDLAERIFSLLKDEMKENEINENK